MSHISNFALHIPAPIGVAFAGLLLYGMIYVVAPVEIIDGISIEAMTFIIMSYGMFIVGCLLGEVGGAPVKRRTTNAPVYSILIALIATTMLGVTLRIVDHYVVRGMSLTSNLFENRMALEATSPGWTAVFGAALSSLAIVLPFCYMSLRRHERSVPLLCVVVILFVFPSVDSLIVGSRSVLVTNISLLLLYGFCFGLIRPNLKGVSVVVSLAVLLVTFGAKMFLNRLALMGMDVAMTIHYSSYALTVQPVPWIEDVLTNDYLGGAAFAWLHVSQYFIHGLFEFGYLYDNFVGAHTLGAMTFHPIYRLLALVLGLPTYDEFVLPELPRYGAYSTFFGPIYFDFGWFWGALVMGMFGFCAQRLWKAAVGSFQMFTPLYLYVAIIIFFAPVDNLIADGQGLFALCATFVYALYVGFASAKMATGDAPAGNIAVREVGNIHSRNMSFEK
ncbi:MAG: O-antigen ligase [Rhodocyclaceae bacterium]|nr:O-antigen ligase [Rhodocyclaceae bacterium]